MKKQNKNILILVGIAVVLLFVMNSGGLGTQAVFESDSVCVSSNEDINLITTDYDESSYVRIDSYFLLFDPSNDFTGDSLGEPNSYLENITTCEDYKTLILLQSNDEIKFLNKIMDIDNPLYINYINIDTPNFFSFWLCQNDNMVPFYVINEDYYSTSGRFETDAVPDGMTREDVLDVFADDCTNYNLVTEITPSSGGLSKVLFTIGDFDVTVIIAIISGIFAFILLLLIIRK